nr:PREDICTED: ATP-dependent DNA helicase PIF1-like [Daucus carota subsp. sativus]
MYLNHGTNNLILEETNYNMTEMELENKKLLSTMNPEQKSVYNAILESVDKNEGGLFFVYGSGGCGKTFLWRTLISKLRSQGDIVLPVASSGIAATLMPGGRTTHSRFKIPIVLDEFSVCAIGNNSDISELIRHTKLIIWDEAPMQHRFAFECLDRSLRDIMKTVDQARASLPFGGITVLPGGDFRQILPVIPHGERGEILEACITRSRLWNICKVYVLKKNMRLNKGSSQREIDELNEFAKWVLAVGDGTLHPMQDGTNFLEDDIVVPEQFCDLDNENSVENMIRSIYPDFIQNAKIPKYMSERAILTPTNQIVGHLNSLIVEMIPGDAVNYYSVDSAEDFGGTDADLHSAFPIEYLNSLQVPGMPSHDLKLKVGTVVMLMRNLNQTLGLCNGTRMIVTKCLKFCVECEVICGSFASTRHFIPRMELSPSDSDLPFKLVRKQMSLQICYAMTINKSQGQSLEKVGLFLLKAVFTHGQFYVAVTRVTSPSGLKVFIDDDRGLPTNLTQNVVYKEVFYALPR